MKTGIEPNSISLVRSSFIDNNSITGQMSTKPRITNDQSNITIPFIKIHKFWNKDPIKVFIDINPRTFGESIKYVADVQKAISTWSNILKIYSGNFNSWNFEINNDSLRELPKASIIIKMSSDPFGQICNDTHVRSYALTIYPQSQDTNAYIDMANSCIVQGHEHQTSHQEMYSTMLHEFGHALGLGHAYNSHGDLMCGRHGSNGLSLETCKPYSGRSVIPSILDLKALFYAYGKDGFNEPNNKEIEYYETKQYNKTVA